MIRKIILTSCLLLILNASLFSQANKNYFIKLTDPLKEIVTTHDSVKYIIGSVSKNCQLEINQTPIKVYPTGAFAYKAILQEGINIFSMTAFMKNQKPIHKKIQFNYKKANQEESVKTFNIEQIQTFPKGDLMLLPGDQIFFRVKAFTGCNADVNGTVLYELPDSVTNGIKGIYQGAYIIQKQDSFLKNRLTVRLTSKNAEETSLSTINQFTVITTNSTNMVITKGRLAHLLYGIGEDRLGGAKMGYLDSMIPLHVIGMVGSNYKVKLAPSKTAYIPSEVVAPLPLGTAIPGSLTGKIFSYGDSIYDYVNIQLFSKLPYQSFTQTEPSKIVVDIFGATNNTNWINQLESLREIKKIECEQIADEIFRVTITLTHHQHWGYSIFYQNNNLIIKVKQQPRLLSLSHLKIAIDAGHGGNNTGAVGPTGIAEKQITLSISTKLKEELEKMGAIVIMTRNEEKFVDNKERILFYRDSTPDLLISIHLNSSNDPIMVSGTSTFYRHEGFRPLSRAIYLRMLELGLNEYGNNGSFNFMLNSPTEYPNALVETLFLSNPEEEMKILDNAFQQKVAEKIS